MISLYRIITVLTAGAALSLAAPMSAALTQSTHGGSGAQPATAGVYQANCTVTKTKYLVVTLTAGTSSTTLVNVPHSKAAFTQSADGCVIVHFAAEALAITESMRVEAWLDGSSATKAQPADNFFAADDNGPGFSDRAMIYVFQNVPAGDHFVQMKYRSGVGNLVQLGFRTTIVQYQ